MIKKFLPLFFLACAVIFNAGPVEAVDTFIESICIKRGQNPGMGCYNHCPGNKSRRGNIVDDSGRCKEGENSVDCVCFK